MQLFLDYKVSAIKKSDMIFKLMEQLHQIDLRKEQTLNKINILKDVFMKSKHSSCVLMFMLIIENVRYVSTGKIEISELDQERMIKEFLQNFTSKECEDEIQKWKNHAKICDEKYSEWWRLYQNTLKENRKLSSMLSISIETLKDIAGDDNAAEAYIKAKQTIEHMNNIGE